MVTFMSLCLQAMLPIIFQLIQKYFEKIGADKKDYEFLIKFLEVMRNKQLVSAGFRLKAEDQLEEIDKIIEEETKKEGEK